MNLIAKYGRHCGICLLFLACLASVASAADPPITAVAFALDGKSVVAVSQSGMQVFGWPKLNRHRVIKTSASNLHCVAFSPNGKQLAIGGGNPSQDGSAEVFSWPAGKPVTQFAGHADSVRSVAWLTDTRLLTASIDREIKLWDLEKKAEALRTFKGHSRSVDAICVVENGKTWAADVTFASRVWCRIEFPGGKYRGGRYRDSSGRSELVFRQVRRVGRRQR